jgi:hypothetical protein
MKADLEFEICVLCDAETDVLRGTPIQEREHYVEACGQTCPKCWKDIMVECEIEK